MMGALMENGPYRLQIDGKTLLDNSVGTWNLDANIVRALVYTFVSLIPTPTKCL